MNDEVELVGQDRFDVVADASALGSVDHTDHALETRFRQRATYLLVVEVEPEPLVAHLMQQALHAARQAVAHPLALGEPVPVGRGGDLAGVRGHPDEHDIVAVPLPAELTHVVLATCRHLGGTRITEVGVVGPHDRLRRGAVGPDVAANGVEGLDHMVVAQVPGHLAPPVHRAVVPFGVRDEAGVLLGGEVRRTVRCGQQLHELLDDRVLAGVGASRGGRVPVAGPVDSGVVEAGVASTSSLCCIGIGPLEVAQDLFDGAVQAIQIEADQVGAARAAVTAARPGRELRDHGVAPHPAREPGEARQRLGYRVVVGHAVADPRVQLRRVRPVAFDGDDGEPVVVDQSSRERGAGGVELRRSV